MLVAENYNTRIPGRLLGSDGPVESCSRCGRPGIRRRSSDGLVCVHEETLEMLPDGLLVTPVDACPIEPLPFAISHPDFI